ncbi:MAG TPA: Rrf2 family transcriptional regulator [Anaeromyxobacteraceae bacterium]|nr:Rrf2 family transcriptional regulator [Anaeromyxobacteraceae bacterium]
MQHVLRISRKIDYAVRAMVHLASIPEGTVVPFREIGKKMDVPEDFLAKILKTLVDHGIVRSTRGPHGGYKLARPAETINMLDIIEAAEGPVAINVCLDGDDACSRQSFCTVTHVWREGQDRMLEVFRNTTLASLVPAEPPPVADVVPMPAAPASP